MSTKKLFAGTIAAVVLSTGLVTQVSAKPPSHGSQPQIMAGRGHAALNLTPEQEAQMNQIRSSTRAQIESVLTPAQKDQLNAARSKVEGRRHHRQIWEQLNLSPQQQAQIDRIRQESKEKMNAVLTPQQREQLQQMRQNRHQNRRQS